MTVVKKSNLDFSILPNLKKHYTFSTIVLILVILMSQSYQDYFHKKEYMEVQLLYIYQQQAALNNKLMSNLLAIRDGNAASINNSAREFSAATKNIMSLQSKLETVKAQRHLSQKLENLAKDEKMLISYVDNLLLLANQVIVLAESGQLDDSAVSAFYEKMLSNYQLYDTLYSHLREKLNETLQAEYYQHRMLLWMLAVFFLMLVTVMGARSYRIVAHSVRRQIKFAHENQRRKKRELDITEYAKVMHMQQMKMRSILDNTVDSIITITADGNIDSFNKTAEKMFGYSAAEVIGQNVKLLMPEDYAKAHDGYLSDYMNTGIRKIIGIGREVVAQRKDQSQFPVYLSVSEVPESQPRLFTGIINDITEWKKTDEKLKHALIELRAKQAQLEEEERIAKHVFENITVSNSDKLPELSSWIVPMGSFSGDMILSAVLPSGVKRVILCDFTGHGLSAALGAIPVSSVHKALAQKDLPLEVLMEELNNKLNALLPTGIFCCIAGVDINASRTHAHVWNAGLPEVLLVSKAGEIKQRIKSDHLPLGVVTYKSSEIQCVDVPLQRGDSLYVYSDGLTDARNFIGEMFGQQRFEQLLMVATENGERLNDIRNTLERYINKMPANDDLSILQIKTLVISDEIILES